MSTLFVENLKGPTTGDNANKVIIPTGQTLQIDDGIDYASMPAGTVIQQVSYSSSATTTTTSTSFVTTGTGVNITPRFSNSNMLIMFSGTAYSSATAGWRGNLYKNGSILPTDTAEDLQAYLNSSPAVGNVAGRIEIDTNVNTTSSINYTYYFKNAGSGTAYWYRNVCMVVQEIKA